MEAIFQNSNQYSDTHLSNSLKLSKQILKTMYKIRSIKQAEFAKKQQFFCKFAEDLITPNRI